MDALHPGAVRIVPEFEVEPAGTYPEAALAERRQFSAEILAVVHEDGRLEVVQGTFEDPIFRDSVRAAVGSAKARPPEVDGKVVTGWTLLRFYFEFVGPARGRRAAPAEGCAQLSRLAQPSNGMWNPGAALPSSVQRAVTALPRV